MQSELSCLKQLLHEKEALIKVLQGHIEELEKRRTPSPITPHKTCETQTSQLNGIGDGLTNLQEGTDGPSAVKNVVHSKKACCTIL